VESTVSGAANDGASTVTRCRSGRSREDVPTAIFVGNDELAFGALRALAEHGLSSDVSVVGYDDVDIASYPAISLTSVNQAGEAMGERAIRLLLERIQGRTDPIHFSVEPSLKVRDSTRPAAVEPTA